MVTYLLSISATWLVSLVLFDLFLKKENYHNYNRFFLLFTFLLGMLLPLWQWISGDSRYSALIDRYITINQWSMDWIRMLYLAGVSVAMSLLIIDVVKLVMLYRGGKKLKQDGWTIIETGKDHPPFSYLDILFVPDTAAYTTEEWTMITAHEKQHSILLHLIDLLAIQLAQIIFWFHPLVYMYNSRLLLVHEYQADRGSATQPQEYGRFLVEQSLLQPAPSLSHSFNRSPIKNRIVMLSKNGTPLTGAANLKKLMLVLPLTIFFVFFFTKNSYSAGKVKPDVIWKKQVTRIIGFKQKEDTALRHLRDAGPDSTLLEMLVIAVNAGKITAYSAFDHDFSTKLSKEDFNKSFTTIDTMVITDPVTGQELKKIIRRDFDFRAIYKYRILEEWTFNKSTGKTDILIQGIEPIKDVYGDDGVYRGIQGMFWLHYNDANKVITRYDLYHSDNTFGHCIWDDYFNSTPMSPTQH
ncbi:MAG: BlaR1 peptidase [Flavipsychrobacter sp.]|nr:BlaR1 peptidase [Flavipsychrobacter sp.]